MALDDEGMHRAGLGFVYRITPVIVATVLYGIYIALLCIATRGLWQRGWKTRSNIIILSILYTLFLLTTTLWALEIAQLMGLVELLLRPKDLSVDAQFDLFYEVVERETKGTSVLFEIQMIVGDILVIWRLSAIWFNKRILVLIPLFWWGLMIINMILCATHCSSGVSSTNYTILCKVTQVLAPVLSIITNVSVMVLTIWKAWLLREAFKIAFRAKKKNQVFSVFVLLIESGTLYVVMLVTDLLVTSFVVGGPESVGRMIDCISGYSTVQFVAIYPTLMLVILRESIWNAPTHIDASDASDNDGPGGMEVMSVSRAQFSSTCPTGFGSAGSGTLGTTLRGHGPGHYVERTGNLGVMEFASRTQVGSYGTAAGQESFGNGVGLGVDGDSEGVGAIGGKFDLEKGEL